VWERFGTRMRTSMRSLPRRMAPILEGRTIGEIELMIQDAIDHELNALSKNPLEEATQ
jgi:hypothetical protein